MIASAPSRDRRTLVLGAVTVAVILLLGRGLPALRIWEREQRAAFEEASLMLSRLEGAQRTLLASRTSDRSRVREESDLRAQAFDAASHAEAASQAVQYFSGLARFSGVQVQVASPVIPAAPPNNAAAFTIRLSLVGSSRALFDLLREIEVGPKRVAIKRLAVTQPDAGADASVAESLRIEIEVSALYVRATGGDKS